MESELQKIDLLRERWNISYKEAKEALDDAGGDVVQALINLEKRSQERGWTEKLQERGQEFYEQIKDMLHKGQETKIKIKQGDKTMFEIPASLGALGIAGALASSELAVLGLLGTLTALANRWSIELDRQGAKGKTTPSGGEGQDPTLDDKDEI